MDRVISVFVGGASEGLKFADKVKECLDEVGKIQCTIWNKDTFEYNETFLNSLTKASLVHDFGIFIASSDDLALIRKSSEEIPRDNVLLEYGLFLGAMGNSRTFLIQEDGCKLPTDLVGYTTPRFKRNFTNQKWTELTTSISENIKIQFNKSEIQLLPSTSLAIGYFNSFIRSVSRSIFDDEGCVLCKAKSFHKDVSLKILIPNELSDNIGAKAQVYYKTQKLEIDEIGKTRRPFPVRYFKSESVEELLIVDIPTTLNAIRPAVNLLIQDSGLGVNPDKLRLEKKELENFKRTLDYLVNEDDYAKHIVKIEWMD